MKRKIKVGIFFLWFLLVIGKTECVYAKEEENSFWEEVQNMQKEIDYSELDSFLEETESREKINFSEIVEAFLEEGGTSIDYDLLLQWGKDILFYEVNQNRQILLEVLILVFAFSMLSHFAGIWEKPYFTEISFVLFYCILAVLLLKSLVVMNDIVAETLEKSINFIRAFIPTYCFTMVFSSNISSSVGFYQLSFFLIYLIQYLFQNFLVVFIHIYVLMELLSHFFEEERFEGMAELLCQFIQWCFKLTWGIVLGLNVVQNLIAPVKDKLTGGTVSKAVSVIPGIGNALNGITEMVLGSGILLKNCVGAAGVFVLTTFCLAPVVQIGCMAIFYQLAGALVQPVADKRIYGCLKGVAKGGMLYLKTIGASVLLFILTIALTTAATSFLSY
ncbi:MAG: stage III sporulation protein AE [Roseburia sp.]